MAYSKCGLTNVVYSLSITSGDLELKFLDVNPNIILTFLLSTEHCSLTLRVLLITIQKSLGI